MSSSSSPPQTPKIARISGVSAPFQASLPSSASAIALYPCTVVYEGGSTGTHCFSEKDIADIRAKEKPEIRSGLDVLKEIRAVSAAHLTLVREKCTKAMRLVLDEAAPLLDHATSREVGLIMEKTSLADMFGDELQHVRRYPDLFSEIEVQLCDVLASRHWTVKCFHTSSFQKGYLCATFHIQEDSGCSRRAFVF